MKFLPQDCNKHQEEHQVLLFKQLQVPQAALNAFCQSHTCIPTMSMDITLASRQDLQKTFPEEESKLSSHNF